MDHICQHACCALIDDGCNAAVEFEVQSRLIHAILGGDTELQDLLKVSCVKGVLHLLKINHIYYTTESASTMMCAGKTVYTVQKSHQPQKHLQKQSSQYQNCTCQQPLGCDNCSVQESVCKGCSKKGHW